MVFYLFILLLRLLSYYDLSLLFFDIVAPPKQRPDQSGVRHTVCITRTL